MVYNQKNLEEKKDKILSYFIDINFLLYGVLQKS